MGRDHQSERIHDYGRELQGVREGEEQMTAYAIVSFSGGKDSTAMLLHLMELGEHIDEVINVDTGMEFPEMYVHIAKVKQIVEDNGIKYTTLREAHGWDWWMYEKEVKGKTTPSHRGYGWPGPMMRWCTSALKTEEINRYLKDVRAEHDPVIQCIGLAADEVKRLERVNNQKKGHRHPLAEWGWTEKDCLAYCYNRGFDWGGLYEHFDRSSCWCCPLQSIKNLRSLRRYHPDLWQRIREMDARLHSDKAHDKHRFNAVYTVEELEVRFAREDLAEKEQTTLDAWGDAE